MAPVIWGLDLKEMQWGKFKGSYMFGNTDYHLRRSKFVVYQLAMIFCVVSESLGTDVLSDYVDSQNYLRKHTDGRAVEHNNAYIGMASYNIFAGIYVATVFGGAFFFDLFWPERREDKGVRVAWKVCSVMACVFMLASCIVEVVIVATRQAYITGVSPAEQARLLMEYGGYPLNYHKNARAIAGVVFAWLGLPCTIWSTVIMWRSIDYTEKFGPFAAHARDKSGDSDASGRNTTEVSGPNTEMRDIEQGSARSNGPMQSPIGRISKDDTYAGT